MHNYLEEITVLYIEDDKLIANEMKSYFEIVLKKSIIVNNPLEALNIFEKDFYGNKEIDIVISDISLPSISGLEMLKKMQEIDKNIVMILTTAYSDTKYFIQAIELGVEYYLLKPLNIDEVFNKIEKAYKNKYQEELLYHHSKMSLIGEMLQNVAHHWRQPLSVISTCASGMRFKKEMNELDDYEFDKSISTILKSSENLSKTLLKLSAFINSNENKNKIELSEIIDNIITKIDYKIKTENVNIIVEIEESIELRTYEHILSQVFIEIINNSIEAFIRNEIEEKLIFISSKIVDSKIVIIIKDNAGGIEEKIEKKIYEPYFTTKHQSEGIGLSLYFAHRLINDSLHGSIYHENKIFEYKNDMYKGVEFKIII